MWIVIHFADQAEESQKKLGVLLVKSDLRDETVNVGDKLHVLQVIFDEIGGRQRVINDEAKNAHTLNGDWFFHTFYELQSL